MEIKFIGVGDFGSRCTSYVINKHILFDVGFGTVRDLRNGNLDSNIDTIVISHLHADHFGDIIYFIISRFAKKETDKKLKIIGPLGTKKLLVNYNNIIHGGDKSYNAKLDKFTDYFNSIVTEIVELEDNEFYRDNTIGLMAFKVVHGNSNCNGYIFSVDNKTLGCSGDTEHCEQLMKNITNADFWIIDSAHEKEKPNIRHLSLEKLESIAKTHKSKNFYAVHRKKYETKSTCDNIFFPEDGDIFIL